MSDDPKAKKKKKGGGMKMILLIVVAMVVGGAGAAGGLYAAGFFSPKEEGPKEDPNKPVLVLAGESAEEIAKAHAAPHGEAAAAAHGAHGKGIDLPAPANPAAYQATYFQLQTPFTSNMSDTDAFAQISVAVSTYYDLRVIDAIKTHEMAIRSQVLMMLAQQPEEMLSTPEGKRALQGKIKGIINDILKQKTGYGGVDNVYFTNFVIQ
ncbi:MAG: flagellar basal body-associated FliL family protein [Pseudomonadota bacterium]|jgi:flagellar FliL protein|uniref:Flagellar protein FliL n=1 Tax=Sphingobium xenophagum TaxID=121428 RepID=A0A249MQC8_SPHXE|nr:MULTISPECIES: flagellar basal body-associated FliL family protein [Sphingobium]MBU0658666.1 flagellar basal body-associated FliL family protein [Alphaproteobacteria bacterium]ASY43556.1 flagellar basal body-associated protein FliL [Sphingobium xenophagum]MBA4753411.1 flagellar basal body-associated FliL family protein [Sphingobium sp.]MBG6117774.1 flagellar FliL protein [Sphingobium sp. JAI105]MBS88798.1 flagellar basal body-associated protein FliL [Sphingobium sp.]|tara:strand:- start:2375 stop:2998 length:624 start_codon:yes stop_codon:yes gene_type:complete